MCYENGCTVPSKIYISNGIDLFNCDDLYSLDTDLENSKHVNLIIKNYLICDSIRSS